MLDNDNWPANPVTLSDLHGLWAHTDLLTILYCPSKWHDTASSVPEFNQLRKLQELLLTGKKEETWFDL